MSTETAPGQNPGIPCVGKGCANVAPLGDDLRAHSEAVEAGWFFRRNGDAWCPGCTPGWVKTWQAERAAAEQAASGLGQVESGVSDASLLAGLVLDDDELRGAVAALSHVASLAHDGAPSYAGLRGRVHLQSLYNEGASPWLDGLADTLAARLQSGSAS